MKKVLSSKALKLLTLLLTSMLIASASAAVYYSISMEPTVTISQAVVQFAQGSDWSHVAGSIGTNNTWCSLSLKAYPNATLTYEQPLNISNTDLSNSHQFRLRHVSITPVDGSASVSNFTFINFVIKSTAGVSQASFNYTTSGDNWDIPSTTSYLVLPANTEWIIYIETKAAAGATIDIAASIVIAVDVLE
jgi:hypothetical protein